MNRPEYINGFLVVSRDPVVIAAFDAICAASRERGTDTVPHLECSRQILRSATDQALAAAKDYWGRQSLDSISFGTPQQQ